jgi:uncharacterized Ntn-hydrolase superfamily protein
MTFSVIGRTGAGAEFGIAIASSSPAVAARCSHARAGAGVVASQNITDPRLGSQILSRLATRGAAAAEALAGALAVTPHAAYRQILALGRTGPAATHCGSHTLGIFSTAVAADCAAAGNLLANDRVPQAMTAAFEAASGSLAERLLAALATGRDAGGEAGPVHAAGLLVVRDVDWPIIDLRVDWAEQDPIAELMRLYRLYAPQTEDYVRRALDPSQAPSFGVPGDPGRQGR